MKLKFSLLFLSLALVGCSTTQYSAAPRHAAGDSYYSPSLVTSSINIAMTAQDQNKLTDLLNTANPSTTVSWKNPSTHDSYTFTSFAIFVNPHGEPCRRYQLSAKTSGFIFKTEKQTPETVACRNDRTQWYAADVTDAIS